MKRGLIATIAAIVCCGAIWQAAKTGAARTLAERAESTGELAEANRAVALAPNDAETHFVRGEVLQGNEDFNNASVEFERAVQLRRRDYFAWLMLGVTRDENQDQDGALRALRQAVALAPAYAPPRWQLGNLLLRLAQLDDAFAELRRAAIANPSLWPNVIDLAWGTYLGEPGAVIKAIKPETDTARLALAIFFARHSQSAAALDQFRQLTVITKGQSDPLLSSLLAARAFAEAYEVWTRTRNVSDLRGVNAASEIRNGGFEGPIAIEQTGFDWQIALVANVTMSVDANEHQSGLRSLRIDWHGDSNPTAPLLAQLLLVKPSTHYQLSLAVKSRDFVSASSPVLTVKDASDQQEAVLAQSAPLASAENGWREIKVDFSTGPQTNAIRLSLSRQTCQQSPCPAFGVLWLDSFQLQ